MDFQALQRDLDSDPALKVAFLRNPAATLRARGIPLTAEDERRLREEVDDALAKTDVKVLLKLTIKF